MPLSWGLCPENLCNITLISVNFGCTLTATKSIVPVPANDRVYSESGRGKGGYPIISHRFCANPITDGSGGW